MRVDEGNVALAMILALIDPATARDLLMTVEPRQHTLGSGFGSVGRRERFRAWALADPRRAAEMLEKEITAWKSADGPTPAEPLEVLDLLTIPPAERAKHLLRIFGGFWSPGE